MRNRGHSVREKKDRGHFVGEKKGMGNFVGNRGHGRILEKKAAEGTLWLGGRPGGTL